jgi:hypothetical protein
MKGKRILASVLALGLGLLLTLVAGLALAQGPGPEGNVEIQAVPIGTAFTYQGHLTDGGSPANGTYDFQFKLHDAASAGNQLGTVTKEDVTVTDGLFTVVLDFGIGAFTGDARWLEIGVRPGTSTGAFTVLSPRQALTPSPYTLALPGLWTQQNATSPNLIGGYSGNSVTSGVAGATIGGGGSSGSTNRVTDDYGTVNGGEGNQAGDGAGTTGDSRYSSVGGGRANTASGQYATVAGGELNTASGWHAAIGSGYGNTASAQYTAIGGGRENTASGTSATVSGGINNTAEGSSTTVGGGRLNTASGWAATVPGGDSNTAQGGYSFAAGRRAKANHQGAFVWADSTDADFASTANDQFAVRANGGVIFSTGGASFRINGGDVWTSANDGSGSGLDADLLDGQNSSYYLDTLRGLSCSNGQVAKWNSTTSQWECGNDNTGAGGDFWSLTGNAGTNPATNFLGTTDNQALELRVNNVRALRLEPNPSSPNVIGGHGSNTVTSGAYGATIGGGGGPSDVWGGPYPNRVTDHYGTVGGGRGNTAGEEATVGGGINNTASGAWASIGGGQGNTVSNQSATVSGGAGNTASEAYATVAGGSYNIASGEYATVGGGNANISSGMWSIVAGGSGNDANAREATIGGGAANAASGRAATIGGGVLNSASSDYVTIGGGEYITVTGWAATVAGGSWITVTGDYASVGGGGYNTASGIGAVIAGGGGFDPWSLGVVTNTASGHWSTIGGGGHNAASDFGSVGGGWHNTASNTGATIGGGGFNTASGNSATVGGGYNNTASGESATVPGGEHNSAQGNYSFAAGYRAKANHNGAFVWADSTDADFASTAANQFAVRANGGALVTGASGEPMLTVTNLGSNDGLRVNKSGDDGLQIGDGTNFPNYGVYIPWPGVPNSALSVQTANVNGEWALITADRISAANVTFSSLTLVAVADGPDPLTAGDLVAVAGVADPLPDSISPLPRVRLANGKVWTGVIGVVESAMALQPLSGKADKDGNAPLELHSVPGRAKAGDYVALTVLGVAHARADVTAGAIVAGQRLTAADQPGHVRALRTRTLEGMVVTEGAPVVGIALAPLDKNTGLIPVLVTLR